MGSCLSTRKRSDAAVTHNASPRSSFSASCKGDTFTAPSPMRARKPSDEIVVILKKDSAALLANTQNSPSSKKSKGKNTPCVQQQVANAKLHTKENGGAVQSKVQNNSVAEDESVRHPREDETALPKSHSQEPSVDKALQHTHNQNGSSTGTSKPLYGTDGSASFANKCATPDNETMGDNANQNDAQEKVLPSFDDEYVVDPSLAKLKRSRSCEEALRSTETKRPLRRRSFQESSTFSPSATKLETIPEPQFGMTKYLEGLDLVDVLPYRPSQTDAPNATLSGVKENRKPPTVLDLPHHESNDLSADFFMLKNRYLSSCSAAMHSASVCDVHLEGDDGTVSPCNAYPKEDAAVMGSLGRMHSRESSLDAAEHAEMVSLYPSSRHLISAVAEGDEDECGSDDSETFEFKQAVSMYAQEPSKKKGQLRNRGAGGGEGKFCRVNERDELCMSKGARKLGRFKELSVVATGDAVLYTGSNSEEFDLIPSKSYVRGSPKKVSDSCPSVLAVTQNSDRGVDDDEEKQPSQGSLSVEDIIFLLERDELDEEVLLSFLNLARSTTPSHAGNMPSCHASDVASEASFEFKVKSPGSTPHSTPSTPMLSAGSTPKRITQLSPLALTPEEIAEIWGVFEQRQALTPFQM